MLIDDGSSDPRPLRSAQIVMAPSLADQAILAARSAKTEALFRTAPTPDLMRTVLDLPALHAHLFKGLCPKLPDAVGHYRGTSGTGIETAKRAVRVRDAAPEIRELDPCVAPEDVADSMEVFIKNIKTLRDDADNSLQQLAALTEQFFAIHPFLDGNGHLWRLCLIALARHTGLSVSEHWSVHERPYGRDFSRALQKFRSNPGLLQAELKRFFG